MEAAPGAIHTFIFDNFCVFLIKFGDVNVCEDEPIVCGWLVKQWARLDEGKAQFNAKTFVEGCFLHSDLYCWIMNIGIRLSFTWKTIYWSPI